MRTRDRQYVALALALCAHAPAAIVLATHAPVTLHAPLLPVTPEELIFIGVEERPEAHAVSPGETASPMTPNATAAAGLATRTRTPEVGATAFPDAPVIAPSGSWTIGLTRAAPPSLDLSPAYTPQREEAVPDRPAKATATDSVRAALDDHDRQLGLGADGPVVTALHRVTMGSRVPVASTATIVATVDPEGNVVAVDVSKADGDPAAWRDVAAGLLESMRGRKVRRPGGDHGLRLGFSVESRSRSVSGHKTDTRSPVWVTPDDAHADRSPSLTLGTPQYRCLEGCTASANIDPTDAVLNATSGLSRTISVKTLPAQRLP